jgi:phospholipase C
MDILHVVALMLENRSFDCMFGMLQARITGIDGLRGSESNIWHSKSGDTEIRVWNEPSLTSVTATIPDPDPGELQADIAIQLTGLNGDAPMGGFVDNYMRQPPADKPYDPKAVMHYFAPDQVPVLSQLAHEFGVSDRWFASAPCQTWPNRFFAHTGTAAGYVNNAPPHFPYAMPTVFGRLAEKHCTWRVYFHDFPQAGTLATLWEDVPTHFRYFNSFVADAASGNLPTYSFIEPRYFTDTVLRLIPNDMHPPHNIAYGEQLVAQVYNALRSGPRWKQTLLIITYDEHGGFFDHAVPPAATPPDNKTPDHFVFNQFGVRVPAVLVSPYIRKGSIVRPAGNTPFDHTTIAATLRRLYGIRPLTARDAAAPDLLSAFDTQPSNDGPERIVAPVPPPAAAEVSRVAAKPPNDLQQSLTSAAAFLPTLGANVAAHIQRLLDAPPVVPQHDSVQMAAAAVGSHVAAFLGLHA